MKPHTLEISGNCAILTMDDGARNVIDMEFIDEMNTCLDEVLKNKSVQALITIGSGRFYCNGINLEKLSTQNQEFRSLFMSKLCKLVARILTFPLMTIAVLNGHAFAGGAFIAFSHDYIVMNESRGWLSINEVRMPSRIPFFLLDVLKCKIPLGLAQTEIITLGKRLTAQDGVRLGVVHRVSSKEKLMDTAINLAQGAFALGPIERDAMSWMKRDLYELALQRLKTEYNPRMISKL